jgi:ATP-dependent Zn protease
MSKASTAFHEAGHAVAARELGLAVRYATIVPEPGSLGHIRYYEWPLTQQPDVRWTPAVRIRCENSIIVALAGPTAEQRHTDRWDHVGASGDYEAAADMALRVCVTSESSDAYMAWLGIRTNELIDQQWASIHAVATALLKRSRIGARTLRHLIDGARV